MDLFKPLKKLRLESFNNLTKTLSFNIYDVCYAPTEAAQREYLSYIDEAYNARRLTQILTEVSQIIGANILNIAHQDYDPQGASVTMLISELPITEEPLNPEAPGPLPETSVRDESNLELQAAGNIQIQASIYQRFDNQRVVIAFHCIINTHIGQHIRESIGELLRPL